MRVATLSWYQLRWSREVLPEQIHRAFHHLANTAGMPLILEVVGRTDDAQHFLAIPKSRAGAAMQQLGVAIPGTSTIRLSNGPDISVARAIAVRLSSRYRPLRTDDPVGLSQAVLHVLTHVGKDECLVLRWILGRSLPAVAIPSQANAPPPTSGAWGLLAAVLGTSPELDNEARSALRTKQAEAGWKVAGRIGVQAEGASRQRQLIRQVLSALQSAEAPGVRFWVHSSIPNQVQKAALPWRYPLRLNATEMAGLSGWPSGPTAELPVAKIGSRLVRPSKAIAREGRIIGDASFPGGERPVSLRPSDALRHLHVLGPTGSGKSTLLLNLITQDLAANRGVVVIEPKGDLIAEVLRHVPLERIDDVVLIDPTDRSSTKPVGLNPLAASGRSPELVADQLLGVFHALFASHWGPRTSDILSSALLTLARTPNMTLAALPLLLADSGFRRRVVSKIDDPIGLEPFWATFESWSEQERANAIAPAMRRLRPFLLHPELRAIIGQARPRVDIRDVFRRRRILLVNLSKGLLGPETAALLGSLVITQLWQATLGRGAVAPERRHPVFVYVDEFQDYLNLPTDFADALAQARGLGVGFVLAHQYLHQLDRQMRSAVLANTQSRIAFRLPHDDAVVVAAGSALDPEDFQSLGGYQCYAQLVAGGTVEPWFSLRTRTADPPTSDADVVRHSSQDRYGVDRAKVEADIRQLVLRPGPSTGQDIGARRRSDRGDS